MDPSELYQPESIDDFQKTRLSRRRMIWLLLHPSPVAGQLPDGRGGGRGWREEPNNTDGETAWSSINHLILSDPN